MINRFLRYSLRWGCPIKLVWLEEGRMKSSNATVVALDAKRVHFITARNKKSPRAMALDLVLAAGYARGDDGDTTKKRNPGEGEADAR